MPMEDLGLELEKRKKTRKSKKPYSKNRPNLRFLIRFLMSSVDKNLLKITSSVHAVGPQFGSYFPGTLVIGTLIWFCEKTFRGGFCF